MRSDPSDRGLRGDQEIFSKKIYTRVRKKLRKFKHVEKEKKRTDMAFLGNTIIHRNFPGCVA